MWLWYVAFANITHNPLREEFDRWASGIPELLSMPA